MDIIIEPPDELHWRRVRAHKACGDTPKKIDPLWVAKSLVYWCVDTDPRNAYYVLLQLPLVGDVVAVSPSRADRVVRLFYNWSQIEPHLHLTPAKLSTDVLQGMCTQSNILRAGLAYAAKFHK